MTSQGVMASGVTSKLLTHEVGAGAPCLKCGDKCPGLDLHFWRKICKNCKCKQENHDVTASFSSRGMDNIEKLLQQDSGGDSFKKSPSSVREPSKASPPGPKPNAKQLHKEVSPSRIKEEQRNGDIKKNAIHQTFESPMPPLEKSNDKAKDELFPEPPVLTQDKKAEIEHPLPPPNSLNDSGATSPDPSVSEKFEKDISTSEKNRPKETVPQSKSDSSVELGHNGSISDHRPYPPDVKTLTIDESPPTPSPESNYPISEDIASKDDIMVTCASSENDQEEEYEWTPTASDEKLVQKYITSLPEEKRPVVGTEGAKYRKKQLMRQLPPHDQEPNECHDLTPQETTEMQIFVKQYRQKALGVAKLIEENSEKVCVECSKVIKIGDPVIQAERAGAEKFWHPACFICVECRELLVDLIYFYNEDKIYCGRHYCELHKPRCAACDELIFAPEYTQAEDSYWHLKHFCCWHCDQPLGGKNYVPHENQPICIPCYEKTFAHTCATCKQIIAPNTEWVTFEKHHWHAMAECFKCIQCNQSLVGKPCIPKGEKVFCSSRCKREYMSSSQK